MKSVSQLVGPNDAQKKPNTHEQMKSPTVEVQNAIINVANPEKEDNPKIIHFVDTYALCQKAFF